MVETENVVLVVGATGNQGGATARRLLAEGRRVRALVRDPGSVAAAALAAAGAELAVGDLGDRASLDRAVDGVAGVFSVQAAGGFDPSHTADDEIRHGRAVADAAKNAGVRHFVYTSVAGADRGTGIPSWEAKWRIEQYLGEIGLPTTVLLPVMFMENTRGSVLGVQPDGALSYFREPDRPTQLIAVEDIGVFAGLAFDDPERYLGRRIELAGDELTFTQIAAAISRAADRPVRYRQIPLQAFLDGDSDSKRPVVSRDDEEVWRADITALRAIHPQLQTFDYWLHRNLAAFRLG